MKKIFLSDLDNTLIYSYKRNIGDDKVLVELKEQKQLSYMTKISYLLLEEIQSKVEFIPITTRSLEQFRRIELSSHWKPRYSLTSNGGILLDGDKIDENWYQQSLSLIEPSYGELTDSMKLLEEDKNISFDIRMVDGLFVFTKSDDVDATISRLSELLDINKVSVFNNGSKVYVLPKNLSKGIAMERMKEFMKADFVISAGDSEFDVPMLLKSDLAVFPESLNKSISFECNGRIIIDEKELFSDALLRYVLANL